MSSLTNPVISLLLKRKSEIRLKVAAVASSETSICIFQVRGIKSVQTTLSLITTVKILNLS